MSLTILVIIIGVFSVIFTTAGIATRRRGIQTVYDFFLASKTIPHKYVANLLFSTSFSLNGIFYQIFLGYKIGLWALVPQFAWALSYWLLGRYADKLVATNGLHKFIGDVYGESTRRLAAACSIVGFALLLGWEYSVARSAITGLAPSGTAPSLIELLLLTVFAVSLLYTLSGGMRANVYANLIQSVIKLVALLIIIGALFYAVFGSREFQHIVWIPRPSVAIAELTLLGFVTNVAFSLAWQFVDTSTWQSTTSTRRDEGAQGVRKGLRDAAFLVFLAPGIFGTLIGIGLSGTDNISSDNVLPALIKWLSPAMLIMLACAIVATVMSTVDGLILASGYALITDLIFKRTVEDKHLLREAPPPGVDRDIFLGANTTVMAVTRLSLVGIAVVGAYMVTGFLWGFGLSLFDVLYVLIVSQLSLFGPVIFALLGKQVAPWGGKSGIASGLLVGFGAVLVGLRLDTPELVTAAGTLALCGSVAGTFMAMKR